MGRRDAARPILSLLEAQSGLPIGGNIRGNSQIVRCVLMR
jgi:hypothetical protein